MTDRPIIIFPTPRRVNRSNLSGRGGKFHYPPIGRQVKRIEPKLDEIQRQFAERARFQINPSGILPEEVIVLETIGSIDEFFKAVKLIPGMEWLAEWDEEDVPPDEDFFKAEEKREELLTGRLFLIMTNQDAMNELFSMWRRYKNNTEEKFKRGLNNFRKLFEQLKDIRLWGTKDRLLENRMLEYWKESLAYQENQDVLTEIELWFRKTPNARTQAEMELNALLLQAGGQVVCKSIIPEIQYHCILASLPAKYLQQVIQNSEVQLVQSKNIMFFRPAGQSTVRVGSGESLQPHLKTPVPQKPSITEPIVALLDGVPLQSHELLDGRIILDDPDEFEGKSQASDRNHGTAMASLICHGELDGVIRPLSTPLYIRPILLPDMKDFMNEPRREIIPENVLPVDQVFRSIRRLFETEGTEPPVAPSVKVINLSIGDCSRPFENHMSPLARLLDWLSWKYNILILVSAGNCSEDISVPGEKSNFENLNAQERQECVFRSLAERLRNRRILSPAETLNGLTVASSHFDNSTYISANRHNFFFDNMPSPINTFGLGFRRAVKPEILAPGGRQLYREDLTNTNNFVATLDVTSSAPGQLVATPSKSAGVLSAKRYTRGTSNSTAMTTRAAALFYENMSAWRTLPGGETLSEAHIPVLLKAMLIHGAYWREATDYLNAALATTENRSRIREHLARFLGYGFLDPETSIACNDQRAVLVGTGELEAENAHVFVLPLPESLSGKAIWRRLTITLAWLSPINCEHRGYRRAALWFQPPSSEIQILRREVDSKASMRGTVQHEVLEGHKAVPFRKGDTVEIQINCRADAGLFEEKSKYALIVTLEVESHTQIPIWREIQSAIRPVVQIRPEV